ncbi:MAG: metallophosphoesterase family protein [Caldilineaceae bacterium]|nr:metallophosphoesterase family protein [Caldilineaceae bacterium]MCB0124192.1 metallophosphoesterase family protein [Caldilineaceae bacterium]
MRVALFSDIHGHVTGLKAIFARLKQLGGADHIYAVGDILGGGPGTEDVLDLLLTHDVKMLMGNWDEVFCGLDQHLSKIMPKNHESVIRTYEWMIGGLSRPYQKLIAELPYVRTLQLTPQHKLLLCHATPESTTARVCQWDTPVSDLRKAYGDLDATIIAYGHYHAHHVRQLDGKILINVAAVGLGWSGLSALTLLDTNKDDLAIRQYQVPYDISEHQRLVQARQMPDNPSIWYW